MNDFFTQVRAGRRRRAEQLAAGSPEWAQRLREHVQHLQDARAHGASKCERMKMGLRTDAQYDSSRRWFALADAQAQRIEPIDHTDPLPAQATMLVPFAVGVLVGMIVVVSVMRFWP